jgi:hypothetical protein
VAFTGIVGKIRYNTSPTTDMMALFAVVEAVDLIRNDVRFGIVYVHIREHVGTNWCLY